MIGILHTAVLLGLAATWVVQFRTFRAGRSGGTDDGLRLLGATVLVHAGALAAFTVRTGSLPLVGLGPASSSLAFVLAVTALTTALRQDLRAARLFILPLAIALLAEAVLVGVEATARQTAFRGPWFVAHVGTAFVGYGGLSLASAAAAMYLLQFRSLKEKRFGSVFRYFPSLDALDRLNRMGLAVGFPALTLGLLAGWGWTLTYGRGLALGDPQVVLGMVTWVAYLIPIGVRLRREWGEGRVAWSAVLAFVVTAAVFVSLRIAAGDTASFL